MSIEKAIEMMSKGEFEEARNYFIQVFLNSFDSYEARFYLGLVSYYQAEWDLATQYWDYRVLRESRYGVVQFYQGLFHFGWGVIGLGQRRFDQAGAHFDDAIVAIQASFVDLDGVDDSLAKQARGILVRLYYYAVLNLCLLYRYEAAHRLILDAFGVMQQMTSEPDLRMIFDFFRLDGDLAECGLWPELRFYRPEHWLVLQGFAQMHLHHRESAIGNFLRVVDVVPDFVRRVRGIFQLAVLHYDTQQFDQAKVYFEQILGFYDQDGGDPEAIYPRVLIQYSVTMCDFYLSRQAYDMAGFLNISAEHVLMGNFGYASDIHQWVNERLKVDTAKLICHVVFCEPTWAEPRYDLGLAYYYLGDYAKAVLSLKMAAALCEGSSLLKIDFYLALGYLKLGLFIDSEAYFLQAERWLNPSDLAFGGRFYSGFGDLYFCQKMWEKAVWYFRKSVAMDAAPETGEVYLQLGQGLMNLKAYEDAVVVLNSRLDRFTQEEAGQAHFILAQIYFKQGRYADYEYQIHLAMEKNSTDFDAAFFYSLQLEKFYLANAQWDGLDERLAFVRKVTQSFLARGLDAPLAPQLANFYLDDVALQGEVTYALSCSQHAVLCQSIQVPELDLARYRAIGSRKFRIGWLTGSCNQHILGVLTSGIFRYFDRNLFEVTVYHYGLADYTPVYHIIRTTADHFMDVGLWDQQQIADRIYADQIDILIETNMFTGYLNHGSGDVHRMSMALLRLAPIQIYFLDFCGHLRASTIDYMISSPYLTEAGKDSYLTPFIHLPNMYCSSFSRFDFPVKVISRDQFGIPEGVQVFGCLNRAFKLEPFIFDTWMAILGRVPDSVLCLSDMPEMAKRSLIERAARFGIEARRLIHLPQLPHYEYLGVFRLIDLFLDPYVYNSHSTALYAFLMDCPILTLPGNTWARRATGHFLDFMGISELIATDQADYIETAVRLATHPEELGRLRDRIRVQKSRLFDTEAWVRDLEKGLLMVWDRFMKGESPQTVVVER